MLAGPPAGPAGHEPRVALQARWGGGEGPDPADHRTDARRRRDRPRLACGRRRLSALHGRRPCGARLREDRRPRRPGLRAWHGPGPETARPSRPARRQHPARPGQGRPSPRERRRGRRLSRVDLGRSGHTRLHAWALGTRRPPAGRPGRGRRCVRPPVSGPRPEPPRRRTGDRGYRGRGGGRRDGCGAPERSQGTGAEAPTAPSWWRGAATPTPSAPPSPSPRPPPPHRPPSSGTPAFTPSPANAATPSRSPSRPAHRGNA